MKHRFLNLRLEVVYRLAKFTNRLSSWFCDKHTELYHEWKREFDSNEEENDGESDSL